MSLLRFKNKKRTPFSLRSQSQKTLHENLKFFAKEQYKLVRANLEFTLPAGEKCPVVGITSALRGEGKSTTAINLSYVLAEKGSRVLLIDGDLRIPSLAQKLDISGTPGLTGALMGKGAASVEEYRSAVLDNWYIMPSGEIPPNPSELLGSGRMKTLLEDLREQFDYIILDLPPVNVVSDAVAVSPFVTGMVIVVREGHTEKKAFKQCYRQLTHAGVKVLGCVMNGTKDGVSTRRDGYYYGYYEVAEKDDRS